MKIKYDEGKESGNYFTIGKNGNGGLLIEAYSKPNRDRDEDKLDALLIVAKEDIGKMMELLKELVKPDIVNHKPDRWTIVR